MKIKDVVITNLKKERARRKMTQGEFSEFLSIPMSTYRGYEYGVSSVSLDSLEDLAKKLDMDTASLITDPENKNKISSRDLLEALASRLGFEIELTESAVNYGTDLHRKISLLGEKEITLLNKTVDKMLVASLGVKKAN